MLLVVDQELKLDFNITLAGQLVIEERRVRIPYAVLVLRQPGRVSKCPIYLHRLVLLWTLLVIAGY